MTGYKLNSIYWIFGKQKNYKTNKINFVLIPFIYSKDGTKIKTIDDCKVHDNIMFKDKLGENNICAYCSNSLDIYDAQIIRSSFLYATYLKLTPYLFLNKVDRSFIRSISGKSVKRKTLYEHTYNELYSNEEILNLGKKWKRSLIKFVKSDANEENITSENKKEF